MNMKTDITSFGEILIDFTREGNNESNAALFAQHPGGAPANVCVAIRRLGGTPAFIGKVGMDMHGAMLKKVLEDENKYYKIIQFYKTKLVELGAMKNLKKSYAIKIGKFKKKTLNNAKILQRTIVES